MIAAVTAPAAVGRTSFKSHADANRQSMTSPSSSQQWVYLSLFTVAGVAVFAVLYFLAEAFIPPAKDYREYHAGVFMFAGEQIQVDPGPPQVQSGGRRQTLQTAGVGKSLLMLPLEEPYPVGRIELIYRGLLNDGRFRVDVLIPELDPNRTYPREISVRDAKDAFQLAGERFRLLAANDIYLHLERLP
jgi:hypothetical protein